MKTFHMLTHINKLLVYLSMSESHINKQKTESLKNERMKLSIYLDQFLECDQPLVLSASLVYFLHFLTSQIGLQLEYCCRCTFHSQNHNPLERLEKFILYNIKPITLPSISLYLWIFLQPSQISVKKSNHASEFANFGFNSKVLSGLS